MMKNLLLWGHFTWNDPSNFNLQLLRGLSLWPHLRSIVYTTNLNPKGPLVPLYFVASFFCLASLASGPQVCVPTLMSITLGNWKPSVMSSRTRKSSVTKMPLVNSTCSSPWNLGMWFRIKASIGWFDRLISKWRIHYIFSRILNLRVLFSRNLIFHFLEGGKFSFSFIN